MTTPQDEFQDTKKPAAAGAMDLIGSGVEGGVKEQFRAWTLRVRSGEMGALPAIGGFVFLSIVFSFLSPFFLTERNFANLLTQAAPYVTLAMALVFVLLLGEIDLSAGVTGGSTMALFVVLVSTQDMNWILALALAFAMGLAIGVFIGFFVAKVGIPSFVVTLGLFLALQGAELIIIGTGGLYRIETPQILAIQNSNLPVWGGWFLLGAVMAITALTAVIDRRRRTRAGVPNRTLALLWIKLGAMLVAGSLVILVLNQVRTGGENPVRGVPIVVPIVLLILWIGTFVLDRTAFGRYIYAIGGNAEAARRAGIKVAAIRWWAFVVCSALAVFAGMFSASKVGSVDAAAGREIVLSGVAAAVVGGVSLFGGRGRLINAAIGGLVIAVITNGLLLLQMPAGVNYAVTGGVLILAATVDALSRRRNGAIGMG